MFVPTDNVQIQYKVRLGDNYLKLAHAFSVEPDAVRQTNSLWRIQSVVPGMMLTIPFDPPVTFTEYRVGEREDLDEIAARVHIDPWRLIRDNLLWDEEVEEGMMLRIRHAAARRSAPIPAGPPKRVHRVVRGETLTAIARRYGTSIVALQAVNALGRRTVIQPGQPLQIPSP